MSMVYMVIYMTACLIFELHKVSFHNFTQTYTACLLCILCSLHANRGHRTNLFLQHM